MNIQVCSTLVSTAQKISEVAVPIYTSTNDGTSTFSTVYLFMSKVENFILFLRYAYLSF